MNMEFLLLNFSSWSDCNLTEVNLPFKERETLILYMSDLHEISNMHWLNQLDQCFAFRRDRCNGVILNDILSNFGDLNSKLNTIHCKIFYPTHHFNEFFR